jgi:hypothetical protein
MRGTESRPIEAEVVIAEVAAFVAGHSVRSISYDATSGIAPAFARHAQETGLPYEPLKPGDVVAACMDVSEMVLSGRLAVDDPLLDAQVPLTAQRPVGQDGAFRFSQAHSGGPIDAVLGMTFAAHAIAYAERPVQVFL